MLNQQRGLSGRGMVLLTIVALCLISRSAAIAADNEKEQERVKDRAM